MTVIAVVPLDPGLTDFNFLFAPNDSLIVAMTGTIANETYAAGVPLIVDTSTGSTTPAEGKFSGFVSDALAETWPTP